MLSHELHENLDTFLCRVGDLSDFLNVVDSLGSAYDTIDNLLPAIGEGGKGTVEASAQLHNHLRATSRATSSVSPRHFYASLEEYVLLLQHTFLDTQPGAERVTELRRNVERFADLFGIFLANQTGRNAAILLTAARTLSGSLRDFSEGLNMIRHYLQPVELDTPTGRPLSLLFIGHLEIHAVWARLRALDGLYRELCNLMNVSYPSDPLLIERIESGSLWVKVFGNSRVMELLTRLLEASASYLYRNRTHEGAIVSIPRKVESVEAILGLSNRLREAGVDTTSLNETIAKGAVIIAREMNSLLAGQSGVTINQRKFPLDYDGDVATLPLPSMPRLPSPDSHPTSEQDSEAHDLEG